MKLQLAATNALTKWLKADLPRLPTQIGKRVGVNHLTSNGHQFSWQVHIIENSYQSIEKTIIATEANSRFSILMPVCVAFTLEELTQRLAMEWQFVLAETLERELNTPRSDIAYLLSDIGSIDFYSLDKISVSRLET